MGDDMAKKIILDRKTNRIKGFLDLEEDKVEKGTEKLVKQKYSPKSDELVIPENELDFNIEETEIGDKVEGGKLIQDEPKKRWVYYLGKICQIGGKTLIREKENPEFDHELSPPEEEELREATGKEILRKEDGSEIIKKIKANGLRIGPGLMSDEKREFVEELRKQRGGE